MALAETLTGPPPIADAAAVAFPPLPPRGSLDSEPPAPPVPPAAIDFAETVPEALGVVVVADAVAEPPAPPLPVNGSLKPPSPPAPPVALERLELFPEASVVVVVEDASAAPPLPALAPLAPAPPLAKAELVESEGLLAMAVASPPLPPSPSIELVPSNEPGTAGTIDGLGDRGRNRDERDGRGRQKQLGFHFFLPGCTMTLSRYSPDDGPIVGRVRRSRDFDKN